MATRKHNENAECINTIKRGLEGLKDGPKMEIHIDILKTTLKRISNWKTPGHDGIPKIDRHSWQTSNRNEQMPRRCAST